MEVGAAIAGTTLIIRILSLLGLFNKPRLDINQSGIEFTEEHEDERCEPNIDEFVNYQFYQPLRRFLNIKVRNKGHGKARKCKVFAKLIEKTPKECVMPVLQENKSLCWQGGWEETDIEPKDDFKSFQLLFLERSTPKSRILIINNSVGYCGIINDKLYPIAWIWTPEAIKNQANTKNDNLCLGKFIFHVTVETGIGNAKISKHIIVRLNNDTVIIPKTEVVECKCNDK